MRKSSFITLVVIVILLAPLELSNEFTPTAAIIRVPDDYPTIQAGIDAADPGDTVEVAAGTYYEHIVVDESIILRGDDRRTIIDGERQPPMIVNITASGVRLEGFTIQNGGPYSGVWMERPYPETLSTITVTNNAIVGNYIGLFTSRSSGFSITNNLFESNQYGIRMYESSFNTVAANTINTSLYYGIYIYASSENNDIQSNVILSHRYGILLEWSNNNDVSLNTMSHGRTSSSYGLRLSFTNNTLIKGNTIEDNNYGIVLWQAMNNDIFYNNFVDNAVQQYHEGTSYTANTWDNDITPGTRGNYWSDYPGVDDGSGVGRWGEPRTAGDGVGDTQVPHQDVDWYPLMNPWTPFPTPWPVAIFSYTPELPFTGETVTFDASASYDPDGVIISYSWDFGDSSPPVTEADPITEHVYMVEGNFTATLTLTDNDLLTNSTSKEITVVPYRLVIDLYSQKEPYSGRGPNQPSDAFAPQEEVILYANVTFNDDPVANKLVTFQVFEPDNSTLLTRTDNTDEYGTATINFVVPTDAPFGTYVAVATVEVAQKMANDTLPFKVGWIIELLMIETVDQDGDPETIFARGEHVLFNVKLQNIAFSAKNVTLTINLYDETNTVVSAADYIIEIPPGYNELELLFNVLLPYWSYVGQANAYADALTKWPWIGGNPYCPEVATLFSIV